MVRKYTGVKARSESSIQIAFTFQGIRCRETIHLKPTTSNLKRAANHRSSIIHEISLGIFDYAAVFPNSTHAVKKEDSDSQSVEEFLRIWLKQHRSNIASSTYDGYKKIVMSQLIPALGDHSVEMLGTKEVREWLSTLDCTNKRIKNILSPLRTALGVAVQDGILENNILKGWSYTRKETLAQRKKRKASLDPFTMLEQSSILEALPEQGMNLMQFAFWTGMRTSELVALTWSDIGWIDNTINVDKGLTQAADEPEITKTEAGERIIKLLKPARLALERQRKHTQLADGVIFHNPRTNTPWEGDQAIRKTLWKPALRKAKVRYRKPYQTRHTYASMMISSGEQIGWVSKQLGHASITITTTTYATWLSDADPDAGSKAESIFSDGSSVPLLEIEQGS